jgi:hypothetical protein
MCQSEYRKGDRRRLAKTRPFALYESVFELIAWGASFRDPNPASPAAISAQFTVAGGLQR